MPQAWLRCSLSGMPVQNVANVLSRDCEFDALGKFIKDIRVSSAAKEVSEKRRAEGQQDKRHPDGQPPPKKGKITSVKRVKLAKQVEKKEPRKVSIVRVTGPNMLLLGWRRPNIAVVFSAAQESDQSYRILHVCVCVCSVS